LLFIGLIIKFSRPADVM